jgi:hypothetical protein
MGTNPVTIIYSEFSLHNPLARQYLNPILVQNKGLEILNYTPRGMNHGYDVYEQVKDNPKYHIEHLGVNQTYKWDGVTPIITQEDINEARARGMSEEMIEQEFMCFPFDAGVMTNIGIKKIGEIRQGDIVLTHSGRWRNVDGVMSRRHTGQMVRIKSAGCFEDIVCTPEHPIRIYEKESQTYSWVKAKDVTTTDYVCYPKLSQADKFVSTSKSLARVIAWYISDGSFAKGSASFSIGTHNKEYLNSARKELTALGLRFREFVTKEGSTTNIVVCSSSFADFLIQNCGSTCYNKKIPLSLIQGHEETVFNELINSDGCEFKDSRSMNQVYQFTTTSKSLAYQVQLLGNTLGIRMTISKCWQSDGPHKINDRVVQSRVERYDIRGTRPKSTYEKKQRTPMRLTKYNVAGKVKKVELFDADMDVFNLNVAIDHTYVVNGRAVHNCNFEVGNVGAYFTREYNAMRIEGRIISFYADPRLPLHTVWDLGGTDSTACILFQVEGTNIKVVGLLHSHGQGLAWYFQHAEQIRKETGCQWGHHWMPHDVKQEHQGWQHTQSRLTQAYQAGYQFQVIPRVNFNDGIEALRFLFTKIFIHKENCKELLAAIREFQRTYDEELRRYSDKPLENWTVHIMDALRYLAVVYRRLFSTGGEGMVRYG